MILPILSRIFDRSLSLFNQQLSVGHVRGIASACDIQPELINKVVLIRNDLNDANMSLLLEAFSRQKDFKKICISHNEIGRKSFCSIEKLVRRNVPYHLSELRIAQAKMLSDIPRGHFAKILTKCNLFIENLSLVRFPLKQEVTFKALCEYISENRHLRKLDLSWNEFTQPFA